MSHIRTLQPRLREMKCGFGAGLCFQYNPSRGNRTGEKEEKVVKENSNAEFFYSTGGTGVRPVLAGGPAAFSPTACEGKTLRLAQGRLLRLARGRLLRRAQGRLLLRLPARDCRQDAGATGFSGSRENWFQP